MVTADTPDARRANALRGDTSRARASPLTPQVLQAEFLDDVYAFVSRRLNRREDVEDVAAEVFAAASEALPKFGGKCEPRLWLLGIARRKVADSLRRNQRRRELLAAEDHAALLERVADPAASPEGQALSAESAAIVQAIVAGLKPAWRDALMLHYADGLTIDEVAIVMHRSPASANSLLQRARSAVYRQGRAHFVDTED